MVRSCPYKCSFCCHHTGPKYRSINIDNVINEMIDLYDKYHYNFLFIYDELFSKRKLNEFSEKVLDIKKNYKMDFDWT